MDFNAITRTVNPKTGNVEPMTVIEYIDKVIVPYSGYDVATISEIKELRDIIADEFDAVYFGQLSWESREPFCYSEKLKKEEFCQQ